MRIHIDYNSSQPIYRQAIEQIKLLVVCGKLQPGDKMPSIRGLARELKINPTTAAKIYTELEHEGMLTLRQGQGAFVSAKENVLSPAEVRRLVASQAQRMIVEGLRLGLDRDAIERIVDEEFERIGRGKHE